MVKMGKACLITFLFVGIAFISENASAKPPKPGVGAPPFDYLEEPQWGSIAPGYKLCSSGSRQSPVHIVTKQAVVNKQLKPLIIDYQITNATLITNGLSAQVAVKGKTEMTIDGKTYRLLSLRWHVPAEHVIDDVTQMAELQQVFVNTDGRGSLVIIATVYKPGAPDKIVNWVHGELQKLSKEMKDEGGVNLAEGVSMSNYSPDMFGYIPNNKYVRYSGSLTTPPCTEQVTWYVITEAQPMAQSQVLEINALQSKANKNNARPVKPLNGRVLQTMPPAPA